MDMHRWGWVHTPLGRMTAVVDQEDAVVRLDFEHDTYREVANQLICGLPSLSAVRPIAHQLEAYFSGERQNFDLRLAPIGSEFLQRAWHALAKTPYGTTSSYGQLASTLEPPSAARAIGRANALNPISIILPCHRVIAANGRMTGYSGGLAKKAALLQLEQDFLSG